MSPLKRVWVLAALLSSAAWADEYLSFKMVSDQQTPFRYYIDSRSPSPAGLDFAQMQNAVERAWSKWNAVSCASPKVISMGPTGATVTTPVSTLDAYNVTPVWMLTADADQQEIFSASPSGAITIPKSYAGVLQSCDIFFNAVTYQWSTDVVTPSTRIDVETALLHEAGHCLGLGHIASVNAVMNGAVQVGQPVRELTSDDITLFCARYPVNGTVTSPCFADGGCSDAALKCVTHPATGGLTQRLCTRRCTLGSGANCELPTLCQPSNDFPGSNGACLMPGALVTQVGKACGQQSDCGSSVSRCQAPINANSPGNKLWADGYCTQRCNSGDPDCPSGSTCVSVGVESVCLADCRIGLADCRPGYACAAIDDVQTSGVCLPRCYADVDCAGRANHTCRICDGLCIDRQNPSGMVGDVCTDSSTCGAGQSCRLTINASQQKQCTQQCARGCATCPNGTTCTPTEKGELLCLRTCTDPFTCPVGLRCGQTEVGRACVPACAGPADCPVGELCDRGECVPPFYDAGCGSLCQKPDAGKPIVITPRDAGFGPGGTAGCGCASAEVLGVIALGAWAARRRRVR